MKISLPTYLQPLCTYKSDAHGKFIVLDVDSSHISIYSTRKKSTDVIPFEGFEEAELFSKYTLSPRQRDPIG